MRTQAHLLFALAGVFLFATAFPSEGPAVDREGRTERIEVKPDPVATMDVSQRTCALEIVLGPFAFEEGPMLCQGLDGALAPEKVTAPLLACQPPPGTTEP